MLLVHAWPLRGMPVKMRLGMTESGRERAGRRCPLVPILARKRIGANPPNPVVGLHLNSLEGDVPRVGKGSEIDPRRGYHRSGLDRQVGLASLPGGNLPIQARELLDRIGLPRHRRLEPRQDGYGRPKFPAPVGPSTPPDRSVLPKVAKRASGETASGRASFQLETADSWP